MAHPDSNHSEIHRNQVALITGSRRGIGLGVAVELAHAGFDVVLNATAPIDKAGEAIEKVRANGSQVEYIQADISQKKIGRF